MGETEGTGAMIIRLVFAIVAFNALTAGAFSKTYTNSTFGLQVTMPVGKVICTARNGESDRGFVVLWQGKECPPPDGTAGIYVYVEYNALGWRSTFEEGKFVCSGEAIRPSPFKVSGFRFYQCELQTDRNRPSPGYFVLRNKKLSSRDNAVSYGVTLVCPHDDCRDLMPMTRWIFAHMKFIIQD